MINSSGVTKSEGKQCRANIDNTRGWTDIDVQTLQTLALDSIDWRELAGLHPLCVPTT